MNETAELADFCASLRYEDLPTEVVRTVKHIVLDTFGVTLAAGTVGEGCGETLAFARDCAGPPEATLIGFGEHVPALAAALANGGMGHALSYDAIGAGHLGSVLAAPLAAAELRGGVDGRSFVTAFAAGLELMARVATALPAVDRNGRPRVEEKFIDGQLLGYFPAAAASARILGLDGPAIHSALGLALMQATGSMQVVVDGDAPAKAVYAAFSNHGGLLAALLARKGLRAQVAALEGRAGLFEVYFDGHWDREELTRDLRRHYRLLKVKFKPWPCSSVTHPFIEAALSLGVFSATEISEIRLRGGTAARHWFEPERARRKPVTSAAAANSIFFTVGRALANGRVGLDDFTPAALEQPAPMVERMSYSIEEDLGSSAIVEVTMRDRRSLSKRVDAPLGSPKNPMNEERLVQKFMDCARRAARPLNVARIVEKLRHLEDLPDMALLVAD